MEFLMAITIGVLFAAGTYLMLSRTLLRVLIGTCLVSHGTLLLLITMGKLKRGVGPILGGALDSAAYVDPLPQALILTAIVIGFGVTAFIIVLSYRAYQSLDSDDTNDFISAEERHGSQH
ncbi:MAG: Na(+)/H(+) antiporter subunit C [Bacillota bacterium]|nr:Na(+)/H(+) antiporter subunit C [Bacillota bacterium]